MNIEYDVHKMCRAVTESTEPEAQQVEQQNIKLQHEEPKSVNGNIDSSVEQSNENKQAEENNEKRETMESKKQSEVGESSVKGQGEETLSSHCEHSEKSESRKGTDEKINDMVVESLHVNERDEADKKQEAPSTAEGFDTQKSKVEPPSSSTKECEDGVSVTIPSQSVDSPKDEDMMPATEKKEPEQSMSMVENKAKSTGFSLTI